MTEPADDLAQLLEFLKRSRGFDFTGYKRSSLERRFRKRMEEVEVATYGEYLDLLQAQPDEFTHLFNTILINVTSFFRDPAAWKKLDEEVLPKLLEDLGDREVRVWSAGCASGEEPYTVGMLLLRHLGDQAFRERVKIYATDVDEDALATARLGTYGAKQVEAIPQDLVERCFERANGNYVFRKDLRRSVIFGRNDLVQDAPISRIDLLLCRKVLMYFNAETQGRMLARFNFALAEHGYLFLGKSEMLLTHGDLFTPVDLKCRIFTKVARGPVRDRLAFVTDGEQLQNAADRSYSQVREGALDLAPVAQLVVDRAGSVVHVNQQARSLFGLSMRDLGRPLQDLEVSYRPVELRSAIEQAYDERRAISLGSVRWDAERDDERRLDVSVSPVLSEGAVLGASVTFNDVTHHVRLRDELERSKRELEVAYEELQSTVEELETTNEELQSTNEELETTNEELQSTNEELQSTNEELETMNEELQSTNEELETMNEELQSTNEELEAINDELRDRSLELNEVNGFLEAILTSLGTGVVVVDGDQRIQIWNRGAENLWGLRSEEARGEHLLALDIGLPVDRLKAPLRAAVTGQSLDGPLVLPATNRRGRRIDCAVTCAPLTGHDGDVRGAVLLMEEREPADGRNR